MNVRRSQQVLQALYKEGVREFCVCAGSRNAPLVAVLSAARNVEVFHFFEERSAGFFALGRCKESHRPVAIVTTSGTAAAELLPAAIEAHYSQIPLVLITADRPPSYRRTGSPQTIEQVGIFSHYVEQTWDLHHNVKAPSFEFPLKKRPVHINVCFDEPILNSEPSEFKFNEMGPRAHEACDGPGEKDLHQVEDFISRVSRPVVLLGQLTPDSHAPTIQLLQHLNAPVYAESLSGLREAKQLTSLLVKCEHTLGTRLCDDIDGVIRIGHVPTLRFWRDLESKKVNLPVLSLSSQGWSGLSRGMSVTNGSLLRAMDILSQKSPPFPDSYLKKIIAQDSLQFTRLENLFLEEPLAEPSLFRRLSLFIPEGARIYLGNSLPVREWDCAATFTARGFSFEANRGANGIDGQLSTFLGWCRPERDNWAIIGDLTALYDLSSPWALKYLQNRRIRIVVINNHGGQIFSRLFGRRQFINEHQIDFKHWSAMWNLPYEMWTQVPKQIEFARHQAIELVPDNLCTERFWQRYESLWRGL